MRLYRLLAALALSGCAGFATYAPQLSSSSVPAPAGNAALRAWGRSAMRLRLPGAGCFQSSYPSMRWSRMACSRVSVPAVIGNGRDYGLKVQNLTISAAIGSFPSVSGVTSVTSCAPRYARNNSCGTHGLGSDVYSLQLNSNTFPTAACATNANCEGWEQFVYTNQPKYYRGGGNLIIQDWLIATGSNRLKCPPNAGWTTSGGDCYKNGRHSLLVPDVPVGQLAEVTLSGNADSSGDSVFFAVGGHVYGIKDAQSDGVTDLRKHWTGVEFNIVGNSDGYRAVLNAGATIVVAIQAATGSTAAPLCKSRAGTTAEENDLKFIAPPANSPQQRYPSILFAESNARSGGTPGCVTLAGS